MAKKKPPAPLAPKLPPRSEKRGSNYCLFHKGEIEGEVYVCPTCKARYCLTCAREAKQQKKTCVKCKQIILLKQA